MESRESVRPLGTIDVGSASNMIGVVECFQNAIYLGSGEKAFLLDEPICRSGMCIAWCSRWDQQVGVGWKDLRSER